MENDHLTASLAKDCLVSSGHITSGVLRELRQPLEPSPVLACSGMVTPVQREMLLPVPEPHRLHVTEEPGWAVAENQPRHLVGWVGGMPLRCDLPVCGLSPAMA